MSIHEVFTTPGPVALEVDLDHGQVVVVAAAQATTSVDVTGPHADDFSVEHRGDGVRVAPPKWRGWGFGRHTVRIGVPDGSSVRARCGSAGIDLEGELGEVTLKCGSGGVHCVRAADLMFESGSGTIEIGHVEKLQGKSGSGSVHIGRLTGEGQVATGSGGIHLDRVVGSLDAKSGSGKLRITSASGDIRCRNGSGTIGIDVIWRGRADLRTTSGRVRLGIEEGKPVWADVSSVSGTVRSTLPPVGEPGPGQDHVELHVHTVSASISLDPAPKGLQDDTEPARPYDAPRGPDRAAPFAPIPTEQAVELSAQDS